MGENILLFNNVCIHEYFRADAGSHSLNLQKDGCIDFYYGKCYEPIFYDSELIKFSTVYIKYETYYEENNKVYCKILVSGSFNESCLLLKLQNGLPISSRHILFQIIKSFYENKKLNQNINNHIDLLSNDIYITHPKNIFLKKPPVLLYNCPIDYKFFPFQNDLLVWMSNREFTQNENKNFVKTLKNSFIFSFETENVFYDISNKTFYLKKNTNLDKFYEDTKYYDGYIKLPNNYGKTYTLITHCMNTKKNYKISIDYINNIIKCNTDLIICDKIDIISKTCMIKKMYPYAKVLCLTTPLDFDTLTYKMVSEVDFLITSSVYLKENRDICNPDVYSRKNKIRLNELFIKNNLIDSNNIVLDCIKFDRIIIDNVINDSLKYIEKYHKNFVWVTTSGNELRDFCRYSIKKRFLQNYCLDKIVQNICFSLKYVDIEYQIPINNIICKQIKIELTDFELELYNSYRDDTDYRGMHDICSNNSNYIHILSKFNQCISLDQYKEIILKSRSVNTNIEFIKSLEKGECNICLAEWDEHDMVLSHCGHQFCKICILRYFNGNGFKCPTCGNLLFFDKIYQINENCKGNMDLLTCKQKVLLEYLKKCKGKNVLFVNKEHMSQFFIILLKKQKNIISFIGTHTNQQKSKLKFDNFNGDCILIVPSQNSNNIKMGNINNIIIMSNDEKIDFLYSKMRSILYKKTINITEFVYLNTIEEIIT